MRGIKIHIMPHAARFMPRSHPFLASPVSGSNYVEVSIKKACPALIHMSAGRHDNDGWPMLSDPLPMEQMPKCAMMYPYARTGSENLGAGVCSADLHDSRDRGHHADSV